MPITDHQTYKPIGYTLLIDLHLRRLFKFPKGHQNKFNNRLSLVVNDFASRSPILLQYQEKHIHGFSPWRPLTFPMKKDSYHTTFRSVIINTDANLFYIGPLKAHFYKIITVPNY